MLDHPPPDRTLSVRLHHAPPLLRISLLGGMTLHIGDREISLSNRKARALIAYLAVTPGMRETRERLVGLLWSETEDGKARASLRQLLHGLRDALDKEGVAALSTDNLHVSLDASLIVTDLDCALASIDRGDPADWLVREPHLEDAFLRGYDDVDPSFGSWLTTKRENVRRLLIQRLEAQLSDSAHHVEATKRIAHALFQIDPTHEIACQHLMRTLRRFRQHQRRAGRVQAAVDVPRTGIRHRAVGGDARARCRDQKRNLSACHPSFGGTQGRDFCEHRRRRFGYPSGGEARDRLGNEIGIRCATRRVWSHAPAVRFGNDGGARSHPRGAAISCSASGRFKPSWRSRQTTNRPAAATMTAPTATSAAGTSPKNR